MFIYGLRWLRRPLKTDGYIPVEYPGIYGFSMGGRTSGTPYSASQSFGFNGDFSVHFLGETLVE